MSDRARQKSMRKSIDNATGGKEKEAFVELMNVAKTSAKNYKWSKDYSDEESSEDENGSHKGSSEDEDFDDESEDSQMCRLNDKMKEGEKQQAELEEKLRNLFGEE